MKWSAALITGHLVRHTFNRAVLAVPNCLWPGSECDLLVVTQNLRVIDVEIKISRGDLKADVKKDKWWRHLPWRQEGDKWVQPKEPREWPGRVWKHYYCMPREVWKPEFLEIISPASGVLLVKEWRPGSYLIDTERRAKPCRDAEQISAEDAVDIARLAGLRMWDALGELERQRLRKEEAA